MSVDLSEFLTSADEDLMNQLRKGPAHLTGQERFAEERFLAMLVERGFPPPDSDQYRINLGGSSFTVADFAYTVFKVAIYIDGLSRNLHGDPANKVRTEGCVRCLSKKGGSRW